MIALLTMNSNPNISGVQEATDLWLYSDVKAFLPKDFSESLINGICNEIHLICLHNATCVSTQSSVKDRSENLQRKQITGGLFYSLHRFKCYVNTNVWPWQPCWLGTKYSSRDKYWITVCLWRDRHILVAAVFPSLWLFLRNWSISSKLSSLWA